MITNEHIQRLNKDIALFPQVFPITPDMKITHKGVSRLIMLERYTFKDLEKKTLRENDLVVLTIKEDPKFPARGVGIIKEIDWDSYEGTVLVEEEFRGQLDDTEESKTGLVTRNLDLIDKPLELFYEQIAKRNAKGLASVEKTDELKQYWFEKFYEELVNLNFIPAGRVIFGAGTGKEVTYFNCFSGDTIVQTKNGAKQIKDLKGKHLVYSMGGEIREADFKSFGQQKIFNVLLENGETIRTTKGHEWFVYDREKDAYEKVKTTELEGKRIPIIPRHKPEKDDDYVRGLHHGIVFGDGTVVYNNEAQVLLFGEKKKLATYFEDQYEITPHYNNEYVRVYGLPATYKELPNEHDSESYWYGFIVGLISTDGYCDSRGSVTISQANKKVLEEISNYLYKTGFVHTDIRMTRLLNPFSGEYSPCYTMQLAKSTINSDDLIRDSHKEHFVNSPKSRRTNLKVVSVEATNTIEEVYCCEEFETRSFVIGTGYLTGNCYVMPFPKDSREGLAEHRREVMEIMSRGGGVGTNGSTLRPKNALAKGVNGKSSGSVSWLDDIAKLTHLVEQGGSRRGAQMMMMADWHPDIIEFIISKMQNPRILTHIIANTKDKQIKQLARNKLKFNPLTEQEKKTYESALKDPNLDNEVRKEIGKVLTDGGKYTVNNPEFLSGANISVTLTDEFMEAVEKNRKYALRFPDTENYNKEQMQFYNENWHKYGDVREWEELGYKVKTYRTIKAKELWNLINICATYSAEPGIFFIDNANKTTNAKAYGQKVVATNPCGKVFASR